jgi:periplasmic divalent cation tolerance protein
MQLVEIRINCPDRATATRIAERLVAARLAASANIGSQIDSIYHWRGAVEHATEVPLVLKTRAALFAAVAAETAALHPYEVPAITAAAIDAAPSYSDWVAAETTSAAGSITSSGRARHPAPQ